MAKTPKPSPPGGGPPSAFRELGLARTVEVIGEEIRALYRCDGIPWVVGYSGGKDSTATLQLVWSAILDLPAAERTKPVYVITTDTLVEQPLVSAWVDRSLARMREAAREQQLPVQPNKLIPEVADTFWVNLIGKGYPAPRQKFRWCTERLKIQPTNKFILDLTRKNGEAIVILGVRSAESQARAGTIRQHAKGRVKFSAEEIRDRLSRNPTLPNSLVYTPLEDWSNDDVWLYLMQVKNPWGHDNKTLLGMYQGATEGGECPLVVDTTTPSCGSSRFGCWVCTVVEKDRSMEAMIKNDDEKLWMSPMLELRNELDPRREHEGNKPDDRNRREFRRLGGHSQLLKSGERTVPGPYTKAFREYWLLRVLQVQEEVRREGPPEFRELRLISTGELEEIRRIWLHEKHEFDDSLPRIYREATGQDFPKALDDGVVLRGEDWELLKEVCGEDQGLFELQVALLGVEQDYRGMARRAGIFDDLKKRLRNSYANEDEAVRILVGQKRLRQEAQQLSLLRKDLERSEGAANTQLPFGAEGGLLGEEAPE